MSMQKGAETVVDECLDIASDEKVVLVNDGNDTDLIFSLQKLLEKRVEKFEYYNYPEPENHGDEPPENVAKAMKNSDIFIAPTRKSISHTKARVEACENGARGATLPGINKKIWNSSLQADYQEVKRMSEKVYSMLENTSSVRIFTDSGTDLSFEVDTEFYHTDTGMIHEEGEFGNLPAGEADGGIINARGTLVVDHMPFINEDEQGGELIIEDSKVVDWKGFEENSEMVEVLENIKGSRNVAEFGFGTNPEAELIGNILQDEKVLGTVHVAIGDNSSYFPKGHERKVSSRIHWDTVCLNPTVYFDDNKVLDRGEPDIS